MKSQNSAGSTVGKTLVIAHRGASSHDGERNTITAFKRAIDLGANGIEFDLRMTSDRVIVVAHDRRIVNDDGRYSWIDTVSYRDLKSALGDRVLTFEELAEQVVAHLTKTGRSVQSLLFDIDLKQPGMEKELKRILSRFEITNIIAASEDIWTLKAFEETCKDARICLTYSWKDRWDLMDSRVFRYATLLLYYSLKPFIFRLIRRKTAKTDIEAASINQKLVNQKVVQFLHQYNIAIFAWAVDSQKRCEELLDLGVDAIKTKRPELITFILNYRNGTK